MSSQGLQGQDIIPIQVWQDFKKIFDSYLPGWQTSGAYNYKATASVPLAALQLDTLVHSGQHPWINKALGRLLSAAEFVDALPEVKTLRLSQLVNYMWEAQKFDNPDKYVAYANRTDPRLIDFFKGKPTTTDMYTYTDKYLTWDNVKSSDAGKAVENYGDSAFN